MGKMAFGADLGLFGSQRALEAMWYACNLLFACVAGVYALLTHWFRYRYIVGSTTVWSGASYIYTKDAVKILSSEERKRRGKP